jgi:hypothetical protein
MMIRPIKIDFQQATLARIVELPLPAGGSHPGS